MRLLKPLQYLFELPALREQISLLKAKLADSESLISLQLQNIRNLEAENSQLKQERDELNRQIQQLQSNQERTPVKYDNRGIV